VTPQDQKIRDDWLKGGNPRTQKRRQAALGELHARLVASCHLARDRNVPDEVIAATLRALGAS